MSPAATSYALRQLEAINWSYANGDPQARAELARRIEEKGRTPDGMLTYSQLVDGVTFHLANVANGQPFQITEWTSLHQAIIGEFLGRIAVDSYRDGGFFASALVYGVTNNQPGEGFWRLAKEAGLLRANSDDARTQFWLEHVRMARAWYAARPD